MLLGLIRPSEGTAQLFGRDPVLARRRALEGVGGFVEAPQFYPYLDRPQEPRAVRRIRRRRRARLVDEMLETVDLADRDGDRSAPTRTG